ncbi:oxalate oxidase [Exidia glandulosa HHB12029]|uniref:Oxalate oxidase n=1 Tax=Exidia glandulosa HHB12029 TaxID=1314781 RepID=A0A165CI12_EXIGL|nr:oxalate oxidase [Exidia glandulosa HHB12029]
MPIADSIAGVNMRLEAGAVRELHWHSAAEWGYMLAGNATITAVDPQGRNYISDIQQGDIWYFPAGIPHSIQGLSGVNNQGCEFLLVFDDGDFSEDETFLVTDWMSHVPMEVLAKSLQLEQEALKEIPSEQLWIFPADTPPPAAEQAVKSPNGEVPQAFGFEFSKVKNTKVGGGTVKIVDTSTFPVSQTISAAEITVAPGGIRELHWHPSQDEWSFFIEGQARMTLFGAQSNARSFNYQPGDVGFVPHAFGHYVENIGNTTLRFLEIFKSPKYEDVSLTQWLALTPPALVKAHLHLSDASISKLSKEKAVVVAGDREE